MKLYIDLGSTNIKYVTSRLVEFRSVRFPEPIINENGIFEVDPEKIMQLIEGIINFINPNEVYFSTQMHGYLLFNKGKRVTNYISWRDERAKNETPTFSIDKSYGVDIKPNLPRLSLQKQVIEYDEFMTLGSFVAHSLTGNNATHITDLTPSGLYNRLKKKYDPLPFKTPKVFDKVRPVGKYNGCDIYAPVGDHQCSVRGIIDKYSTEDCYVLNIGTASQLCCINDVFLIGEFESRPYFENKTLCTISRLPGGEFIKEFTNKDTLVDTLYREYSNALKKLPVKSKVIVTGGGTKKHRDSITIVLKKIAIEYIYNDDIDALYGLNYIAKGENI